MTTKAKLTFDKLKTATSIGVAIGIRIFIIN